MINNNNIDWEDVSEKTELNISDDIENCGDLTDKNINVLDKDPWIKCLKILYKFVLAVFILISIFSIINLCNFYDNSKLNGSTNCDDYKYGCCEIYDTCKIIDGKFISTSLPIDPRIIHKLDELGTNCPRLTKLVYNYEKKYNDNCLTSEYGCCKLNNICDIREYYGRFYNESKERIADIYHSNLNQDYI